MIFEHTSYRSYLKTVLADRVVKNPAYSLRSLAKSLEMAPSLLSEVTRGSKNLSYESAHRVAQRLNLSDTESEYFTLLVQYESAKTSELKENFLSRLRAINPKREIKDLSMDAFKAIADWYHIPILAMTDLSHFKFTPENIAKRLGITRLEAEVAIERLMRLELLERDKTGRYRRIHDNSVFQSKTANQGLRQFHKQMLALATESLETQSNSEKFVGSETFAVDPQQLDEAKAVIEEFFTKMIRLFGRGKTKTEAYHLGVQLFNLTKGRK